MIINSRELCKWQAATCCRHLQVCTSAGVSPIHTTGSEHQLTTKHALHSTKYWPSQCKADMQIKDQKEKPCIHFGGMQKHNWQSNLLCNFGAGDMPTTCYLHLGQSEQNETTIGWNINRYNSMLYQVFTVLLLKLQVFCNVILCCWDSDCWHFKGP